MRHTIHEMVRLYCLYWDHTVKFGLAKFEVLSSDKLVKIETMQLPEINYILYASEMKLHVVHGKNNHLLL